MLENPDRKWYVYSLEGSPAPEHSYRVKFYKGGGEGDPNHFFIRLSDRTKMWVLPEVMLPSTASDQGTGTPGGDDGADSGKDRVREKAAMPWGSVANASMASVASSVPPFGAPPGGMPAKPAVSVEVPSRRSSHCPSESIDARELLSPQRKSVSFPLSPSPSSVNPTPSPLATPTAKREPSDTDPTFAQNPDAARKQVPVAPAAATTTAATTTAATTAVATADPPPERSHTAPGEPRKDDDVVSVRSCCSSARVGSLRSAVDGESDKRRAAALKENASTVVKAFQAFLQSLALPMLNLPQESTLLPQYLSMFTTLSGPLVEKSDDSPEYDATKEELGNRLKHLYTATRNVNVSLINAQSHILEAQRECSAGGQFTGYQRHMSAPSPIRAVQESVHFLRDQEVQDSVRAILALETKERMYHDREEELVALYEGKLKSMAQTLITPESGVEKLDVEMSALHKKHEVDMAAFQDAALVMRDEYIAEFRKLGDLRRELRQKEIEVDLQAQRLEETAFLEVEQTRQTIEDALSPLPCSDRPDEQPPPASAPPADDPPEHQLLEAHLQRRFDVLSMKTIPGPASPVTQATEAMRDEIQRMSLDPAVIANTLRELRRREGKLAARERRVRMMKEAYDGEVTEFKRGATDRLREEADTYFQRTRDAFTKGVADLIGRASALSPYKAGAGKPPAGAPQTAPPRLASHLKGIPPSPIRNTTVPPPTLDDRVSPARHPAFAGLGDDEAPSLLQTAHSTPTASATDEAPVDLPSSPVVFATPMVSPTVVLCHKRVQASADVGVASVQTDAPYPESGEGSEALLVGLRQKQAALEEAEAALARRARELDQRDAAAAAREQRPAPDGAHAALQQQQREQQLLLLQTQQQLQQLLRQQQQQQQQQQLLQQRDGEASMELARELRGGNPRAEAALRADLTRQVEEHKRREAELTAQRDAYELRCAKTSRACEEAMAEVKRLLMQNDNLSQDLTTDRTLLSRELKQMRDNTEKRMAAAMREALDVEDLAREEITELKAALHEAKEAANALQRAEHDAASAAAGAKRLLAIAQKKADDLAEELAAAHREHKAERARLLSDRHSHVQSAKDSAAERSKARKLVAKQQEEIAELKNTNRELAATYDRQLQLLHAEREKSAAATQALKAEVDVLRQKVVQQEGRLLLEFDRVSRQKDEQIQALVRQRTGTARLRSASRSPSHSILHPHVPNVAMQTPPQYSTIASPAPRALPRDSSSRSVSYSPSVKA
ncbi:hypothetical protein DIPPA_34921 [Diplonema papillatum]|nr:hypothetical protein DIPPA_34921 [Diplonema papillatum]